MENNARLKITTLDGSIKYSETLNEKIERLNLLIIDRVDLLESSISKSAISQVSDFRESLIDKELQDFYFNELIPEFGKVRFIELQEK